MAHTKPLRKDARPTLEVGYWVALVLTPNTAPLRCYVGEVQAVDTHGIRLTLVDWLTSTADSWDLFVPWAHVSAALIATPEHDLTHWFEHAALWQERMGEREVEPGAAEEGQTEVFSLDAEPLPDTESGS